jgi:monothiol glutaredoxin
MKIYSQWPTFPQLYVEGKLVGGADIVRDMHQSGELAKVLGVEIDTNVEAPKITLSASARKAIVDAQKEEAEGEPLRIGIAPGFGYELYFDAKKDTDLILDPSIPIVMDPGSAKRAKNLTIDFVGGGFKIENEAEPPRVRPMKPKELKEALDKGERVVLLDVRTDEERAIAKLEGSLTADQIESIDKDARVVVYCHHGIRSRAAAERLVQSGFSKVFNLEGGIDAWSSEVDPRVAKY